MKISCTINTEKLSTKLVDAQYVSKNAGIYRYRKSPQYRIITLKEGNICLSYLCSSKLVVPFYPSAWSLTEFEIMDDEKLNMTVSKVNE